MIPDGKLVDEIIREELEAMRQRVEANMRNAQPYPPYTTGETAASMVVSVSPVAGGYHGELTARPFFEALETGTKPWAKQYKSPPPFFVEIIEEWATAKGISISPWLTARKIMREGSRLFRDGGREDIYSNEIEPTIERITERIAGIYEVAATESILRK